MATRTTRGPDRTGGIAQDAMTLRDYFAAQVIAATDSGSGLADEAADEARALAHWAYMVADAMLAARDTTPPKDRGNPR